VLDHFPNDAPDTGETVPVASAQGQLQIKDGEPREKEEEQVLFDCVADDSQLFKKPVYCQRLRSFLPLKILGPTARVAGGWRDGTRPRNG
jgi:hypothetical protein